MIVQNIYSPSAQIQECAFYRCSPGYDGIENKLGPVSSHPFCCCSLDLAPATKDVAWPTVCKGHILTSQGMKDTQHVMATEAAMSTAGLSQRISVELAIRKGSKLLFFERSKSLCAGARGLSAQTWPEGSMALAV